MPEVNEPLREQDPEEQVRTWQGRIALAERYMKEHGDTDERWKDNVKALAGDFNSVAELGDEAIDVNYMRSTLKTVLPPLTINEPHVTVRPTTRETPSGGDNIRGADVTELEINYWMRELEVRRQVKLAMLDTETTNHGYIYVGWAQKSDVENKQGERTENEPTIQAGRPFVRRHSPRRLLVPPGYSEFEEHPWIDLVFIKPLRHIKEKYPTTTEDLQGTKSLEAGTDDSQALSEYLDTPDAQLVEIHNIWCKETGKVYILAKGHEEYLEPPEDWPWATEGFPVEHYSSDDVPDEYFATPPMSFTLPQNKELNATRTAMRKRRNRTKQVIFVDSEHADEVAEKYAMADDGTVIPVQIESDKRLGDVISVTPGVNIDNSDLAYDSVIKGDLREGSGLGAEQRGGGDPNIDSATASANVQQGANIRQSERADGVRGLYLGVARKLWVVLKQHPNQKRNRLILGRTNAEIVRNERYTLKELQGEFNFHMDVATVIASDPQRRQTEAILNYNLFRADPLMNHERLIQDVFQAQNKLDIDGYMLSLRQPKEELQLMIQGIPVEANDRDDHMAHMAEHDQQSAGIVKAFEEMPPDSQQNIKTRLASALMLAHINDHARRLQRMQGDGGQQAGKPVAENMLRNQVRAGSGETAAELTGQPLTEADTVQ